MARRYDPGRRDRLADAAVRVISRDGITALSHRAVAAEADVPLGSTTYHYKSLDDLLVAALRKVNDTWLRRFQEWSDAVGPGQPLAGELARFVEESLSTYREQTSLEYEFYFAGLRDESVRPLAGDCLDAMADILSRHVPDRELARAVIGLLDGLLIQLLLTGRTPDTGQLRVVVERLLPQPATTPGTGSSPTAPDG